MDKIKLINSFIAVGIIFIITGGILDLVNRPGSDTFILIGKGFTTLFSVIASIEIVTSKNRTYISKAIWLLCLFYFAPFAVLVYFFRWHNGFAATSIHSNTKNLF